MRSDANPDLTSLYTGCVSHATHISLDHAKHLGVTYLLMTIWPRCAFVWFKFYMLLPSVLFLYKAKCIVYSAQVVSVYQRGGKKNTFTTRQCLKPERASLVPVMHFDTYSPMLMTLLSLQVSHRLQYLSFAATPCHDRRLLSAEAVWHFEAISPSLFCPSLHLHVIKTHTLCTCLNR